MSKRLKKGDEVIIITGKHKGTKTKITKVDSTDYVQLEGIERVKHVKKQDGAGEKLNIPAPIHRSNVMHFDSHSKSASRISYTRDSGKLQRLYKKSSEKF